MRLSLWIAVSLLATAIVFYACTRKDTFRGLGNEGVEGFSIEKARKAYADLVKREGNIVPDQERLSIAADGTISRSVAPTGKPNKKVVLWSKAKLSVSPNGNPFVELPLLYNKKTSSVIIKKGEIRDANDETKIFNGTINRLLIYLDQRTGTYVEYIVDYIPRIEYLRRHNGDISSNRMSELNKDFSGYVQYKKWDGTRLALYELKDGKTVKFIRFTNSDKNIKVSKMHSDVASSSGTEVGGQSVEKLMSSNMLSVQSKISAASSSMETCEWVDIYDYQTVCWETNPEDPMEVTCTSVPVLVGSDYVCTGGEDDPDPEDDPCDWPENYQWCFGNPGSPGNPNNPNNPNNPSNPSQQSDPCPQLNAQNNSQAFKDKVSELEGKTNLKHETGYSENKSGSFSALTPSTSTENSDGLSVDVTNNTKGAVHTHQDEYEVADAKGETQTRTPFKMFSPADVNTLMRIVDQNKDSSDFSQYYVSMVTSSGNYTLKFTGTVSDIKTGFGGRTWNEKYTKFMQGGFFSSLENRFLRFLKDEMGVTGVSLYKVNSDGTSTKKALNSSNKVVSTPCPPTT